MKTYSATLILLLFSSLLIAQERVTDISPPFKLKELEIDCESFQDKANPKLAGEMMFVGDGNNNYLEPLEPFTFKFRVKNIDKGRATCLEIYAENLGDSGSEIDVGRKKKITKIESDGQEIIELKIVPSIKLREGLHKIRVHVKEWGKLYHLEPLEYQLESRPYSPDLKYGGYVIKKEPSITTDGTIEKNEEVNLGVIIQNASNSRAFIPKFEIASENKEVLIYQGEFNKNIRKISGSLRTLEAYEIDTISFNLRVTGSYEHDGISPLPIKMKVTDSIYNVSQLKGLVKTSVIDMPLDIELDTQPSTPFIVKGTNENSKIGVTNQDPDWDPTILDELEIADFPDPVVENPNAAALIIGIEDYSPLRDAPYARQDARIMSEYMRRAFGVSEKRIQIRTDKQANNTWFLNNIKSARGLRRAFPGRIDANTDLYVYYSGHGMPSKSGDKVYLFPSDGNKELLTSFGVELNQFYTNLASLGAKSVTVIMDACFSGNSRASSAIETVNISGNKGGRFRNEFEGDWQNDEKFIVITSSSGDETSLGNDVTKTGLFTYYLAAGLKGNADGYLGPDSSGTEQFGEKDGQITTLELFNYVLNHVSYDAENLYEGGKQTPTFLGQDFNRVLVDRK